MLSLSKEQLAELIEHSKETSPNEACGILAGKDGCVRKVYRMANNDASPESYFMDPKEQLKVMKDMRSEGLDMVGIYHSHPHSRAYPSAHDVKMAFYSEVLYIIISLKDKEAEVKAFRIVDEKITEEEVAIQ